MLRGAAEQFQTWVKEQLRDEARRLSTRQRAGATNLSNPTSRARSRIRLSSFSRPESRRGS
jgi:hypothetical protein